jgi:hypothetical protein
MAEDEDSETLAEAEGPCCLLHSERCVRAPAAFAQIRDSAYRTQDAASWARVAEKLDRAAKSGKLDKDVAAWLATVIRSGFRNKEVPCSWVDPRTGRPKATTSIDFPSNKAIGAVAYNIAVERGYITDPCPVQTIKEKLGIGYRRWRQLDQDYRDEAEAALEQYVLNYPDILVQEGVLERALLPKGDMK